MTNTPPPSGLTIDPATAHFPGYESDILDSAILEHALTPPVKNEDGDLSSVLRSITTSPDLEMGTHWPGYGFGPGNQLPHSPVPTSHSAMSALPQSQHAENIVAVSEASSNRDLHHSWERPMGSGSCTPRNDFDSHMATFIPVTSSVYQHPLPTHPPHLPPFNGLGLSGISQPFYPNNNFNGSPSEAAKAWGSATSMTGKEAQESPSTVHSTSPLQTGVETERKKNTRFIIPTERNLNTIDHLIAMTSDEKEIKELKQQKRLLRNRQAALDSRQRKKQHTERLEEERKHYTNMINHLQENISSLNMQKQQWESARESWNVTTNTYLQHMERIDMEKEELVRAHTLETAELRKKNFYLCEQVHMLEEASMTSAPGSAFTNEFGEFGHLAISDGSWDQYGMTHDFAMDRTASPPPRQPKPSPRAEDKGAAPGLLLMLLLCGAWVASQSSPSTAAALPIMSEDVRVASKSVLEHIYKDTGIRLTTPTQGHGDTPQNAQISGQQDAPSNTLHLDRAQPTTVHPMNLHMTSPTREQAREQAFSLTPAQYNELHSGPMLSSRDHTPPRVKAQSLKDSLTAMEEASNTNAAETYTRSLLWDKVPTDVLHEFANMVAANRANT